MSDTTGPYGGSTTSWYLRNVAGAESTYRQFDNNPGYVPYFGVPDGYGVMQIDSASGDAMTLGLLYNRQANADQAKSDFQGLAQVGTRTWSNEYNAWHAYNALNPNQQVPPPPDVYCGNDGIPGRPSYWCTNSASDFPGPYCRFTWHFRDAITLKRYNGASACTACGDNPSAKDFNNQWVISFLNVNANDYVGQVCAQQP